jgi:hypothetical protein
MNTRRDFLTYCSLLAAGTVLNPMESFAAPLPLRVPSIDHLGLSDFRSCVDTQFRLIRSGQPTLGLTLVEARSRSSKGSAEASEHQFSLLFLEKQGKSLEQNTYSFDHHVLGRFSMFIVPVERSNGAHCFYEAVFDRQIGPIV